MGLAQLVFLSFFKQYYNQPDLAWLSLAGSGFGYINLNETKDPLFEPEDNLQYVQSIAKKDVKF